MTKNSAINPTSTKTSESNQMIKINKHEVADWIGGISDQALMLTIAKPHAKALNLRLDDSHLQHLLRRIIEMANHRVFGRDKRYEFMRGLVVMEQSPLHPHFHIVFRKPEAMEFETFKRRLGNFADRLCDPDFELDLSDAPLHPCMRKALSRPCYPAFAKLTDTHANTGAYLTKQFKARYYALNGRRLSIYDDRLEVLINHKHEQEVIYA